MNSPDLLAALVPIIRVLEQLEVGYYIGGSVASSAHGIPRTTLDVDLVANLGIEHIDAFIAPLSDDYYVDREAVEAAINSQRSFNMIHQQTVLKIDVFVLPKHAFDRDAFRRRIVGPTLSDDDMSWSPVIATAEDIVLHKLRWYRDGGEVSERQLRDVIGVLKVQRHDMDFDYLAMWGSRIGVEDLLDRARTEAGLGDSPKMETEQPAED